MFRMFHIAFFELAPHLAQGKMAVVKDKRKLGGQGKMDS